MLESPKLGKNCSERVDQNEYELTKMSTNWPSEYELTKIMSTNWPKWERADSSTNWLEYELTGSQGALSVNF